MPNFCPSCGTPSSGAAFCVKCGTHLASQPAPAPAQPAPAANYTPPPAATYTPAAPRQGMSTLAKVGIAFLVFVVFIGIVGVAGALYVAHRVKQKVHEIAAALPDSSSSSPANSSSSSSTFGNVCRFLSKDEVSRALNITVVAIKSEGDSCQYLVHGDAADLTAKHVAALGASHGADAQQQNMVQNFAATIFKSQPNQGQTPTTDANGNAPILVIALTDNGATQMRLEKGTLGRFPGSALLSGVGDEAFVAGDVMIIARKGNRMVHVMYSTCPCTTKDVTPLARKLADRL